MKWFILLILFISFLKIGISGNIYEADPSIKGTVLDTEGAPLEFATVAVFKAETGALVTGGITDESGRFSISIEEGNYFIEVDFLSFEKYKTEVFEVGKKAYKIADPIQMSLAAEQLEGVEITEKASYVKLELDKKVFVVGSDLSNTGGNAADILKNVPSVEVDVEGNVSLRGSENVRILIDGKPSGLTGIGDNDALRHLQGNMVEKVEVITNPSAKYDAEGEAGIINLVLKKDKRKGFNGSFELGAGYPHNYSASYNINYRKDWYNLFTSFGLNFRESPGKGFSNQVFTFPDTTFAYNSTREHTRGGMGTNLRLGSDIFISPLNTLTLAFIYSYANEDNEAKVVYTDLNSNGDVINESTRIDNENEIDQNIELDLRYEKKFKQKDQVLTADLRWNQGDDTEKSNITETSTISIFDIIQRSSNVEDQRNYNIQIDYVHPFSKDMKLEIGTKAGLRRIINDYLVEEQNTSEQWEILEDFNNEFRYDENIYAAYVSFSDKIKRFNYKLGTRLEFSDITTDLIESEEKNVKEYVDFFPSAHFSYEFPKMHTVQLSYSRRISRPGFRWLLPFFSFSNSRNFYSGNPNLNPEYTNSVEAGYLKRFKKGSLLFNVYYRKQEQVIQRFTTADSLGNTTTFPINAGEQDDIGFEVNLTYQFADWWRINAFGTFYSFDLAGSYNGQELTSSGSTAMLRGNSNFSIKNKVDLQTSFSYRAPRESIQGRSKSSYSIDLGASMDLFKNNGTLTLSARDIFNTRKRRSVTQGTDFQTTSEFQWRSRQVDLTLIYRINQKKSRASRGNRMDEGDF
ncbi:MAG: TonB-dependent receptor [Chitinophagales bacterium]|nr:TonB-dependent receptor [Chitinophagales bacterium]